MTEWDGRPRNPERDGWHWLLERHRWCRPEAVEWCSKPGVWRGKGPASAAVGQEVRYLGPCLTPAEVEAREAAARREALEEAAKIALRIEVPADAGPIDGHARVMASVQIAAAIRALMTEGAR